MLAYLPLSGGRRVVVEGLCGQQQLYLGFYRLMSEVTGFLFELLLSNDLDWEIPHRDPVTKFLTPGYFH
jgi:hypothetical protein